MAKAKEEGPQYNIMARIVVISELTVSAKNFEEALEKSKSLREKDYITIDEEYNDGSFEVVGISKQNGWNTD